MCAAFFVRFDVINRIYFKFVKNIGYGSIDNVLWHYYFDVLFRQ